MAKNYTTGGIGGLTDSGCETVTTSVSLTSRDVSMHVKLRGRACPYVDNEFVTLSHASIVDIKHCKNNITVDIATHYTTSC